MQAICIGALPSPELAEQLAERCAGMWNVSGCADGALAATCGRIERPAESLHSGRPLGNTSVWILDDQQQPCPIGAIGEIYVGGASLSRPFGVRAEAAQHEHAPMADSQDMPLQRTHSHGRWLVSGNIQEMGRVDRRERIDGREVDLATVEAELLSQPGVMRAVAVGALESCCRYRASMPMSLRRPIIGWSPIDWWPRLPRRYLRMKYRNGWCCSMHCL